MQRDGNAGNGPAHQALAEALAEAGCVAPDEEADELVAAAAGDNDRLEAMLARRCAGHPLAWVTGGTTFAGTWVAVYEGVYVPRWQSGPMVARAAELLPARGTAVDLCTGSGAVAKALMARRPLARVLATELDDLACRCAAANGVEVYQGHMAEALPGAVEGQCDVVVGVVPYVPRGEMQYLPRDVREHEPVLALDGGEDGIELLAEAVVAANALLRPGGRLLLELGGGQDALLAPVLAGAGFGPADVYRDTEGDLRWLQAQRLGEAQRS